LLFRKAYAPPCVDCKATERRGNRFRARVGGYAAAGRQYQSATGYRSLLSGSWLSHAVTTILEENIGI
jgi:hypothetical protein